jgi:hypothetical protein
MFIDRGADPPPAPFEGAEVKVDFSHSSTIPLLRTELVPAYVSVYKYRTPNGVNTTLKP